MSAVFTWIETFDGAAVAASWEALAAGRTLADAFGVPLIALVFGENAEAIAAEAGHYGADQALVCADATLNAIRLEPYAALLTKLVQDQQPKAVAAAATGRGRELLAASAADTEQPAARRRAVALGEWEQNQRRARGLRGQGDQRCRSCFR